ncbi:MAG: hypothetical protein N2691_03325 [Patescibacteria group bacterium]|nr:hypothetical protein [Patescibacteria group bacterium]
MGTETQLRTPKAALLSVLYETPPEYRLHLEEQTYRLGISLYLVDHTGTGFGYAKGLNSLLVPLLNQYDVFFLANPDIRLETISRRKVFDAMEVFDVWGYAMDQNGSTYYGGLLDPNRLSGGLISQKPKQRFATVDFVSGSLMGVRREVFLKTGILEESYGMYYEDVDFCMRARRDGFLVGIDSAQHYQHLERSDSNPNKKRWLSRSRFRFLLKFGTPQQKLYELLRLPKTWWEEGFSFL